MSGGGNLVWVGVLQVTGIRSGQGARMKKQEWRDEYGRLVREMMTKAEASDRYAKRDDPNRPERDQEFARVQEELMVAMHNLEEFWKKFHSGQVTLE